MLIKKLRCSESETLAQYGIEWVDVSLDYPEIHAAHFTERPRMMRCALAPYVPRKDPSMFSLTENLAKNLIRSTSYVTQKNR